MSLFRVNRTEQPSNREIIASLLLFANCDFVLNPTQKSPTEQQRQHYAPACLDLDAMCIWIRRARFGPIRIEKNDDPLRAGLRQPIFRESVAMRHPRVIPKLSLTGMEVWTYIYVH